jgi:type IX secretion system PorP/SprF family membrane protein
MSFSLKAFVSLIFLLTSFVLAGQLVPSTPFSYPLFSQMVFNPAISGSKEFSDIKLMYKVAGSPGAQMASYSSRIKKESPSVAFSRVGIGGYLFNENMETTRLLGGGIAGAYHIPLGSNSLSFLSVGVAARAFYRHSRDEAIPAEQAGKFTPAADIGIYYYGPYGFAGISSTNILSLNTDSLDAVADENITRREHFYGGARIPLSRNSGIVLEPSLLISLEDFTAPVIGESLVPFLKLYIQNACIGTYYRDLRTVVIFLQYQFPRVYGGLLIEYPTDALLITSDPMTIDLTVGLRLNAPRSRTGPSYHW